MGFLFRRLVIGCCIVAMLSSCAPVTVRGGEGKNFWSEYHSCDGSSQPRTLPEESEGGSGSDIGGDLLKGSGEIGAAVVLIVLSAVGIYYATCEGIDKAERLTEPPAAGSIQQGIYRAPYGVYTVAVPGQFAAEGPTDFKVHEITSQAQKRVSFEPTGASQPSFAVSVITRLGSTYTALSLEQFAARVAPLSAQDVGGEPAGVFALRHEEHTTLDSKPAIFRIYTDATRTYLLYILKQSRESALVSVSLPGGCPGCDSSSEMATRAAYPAIAAFIDSFHLSNRPKAAP